MATANAMSLIMFVRDRLILDFSKEGHVRAKKVIAPVTARFRTGASIPASEAWSGKLAVRDPDQPGCRSCRSEEVAAFHGAYAARLPIR